LDGLEIREGGAEEGGGEESLELHVDYVRARMTTGVEALES
jgi:hypothetical protein